MNYATACARLLATISVGLSQQAAGQAELEPDPRWCDRVYNADCDSYGVGGLIGVPLPAARAPGRTGAPIDLTGFWTSVITEDWRWRVLTPPKGDYTSLPLNEEGVRVANMWDPERDADTCRHYGAAGLMRNPLRLRIEWEDDMTLRVDTDHGMQTRRFHFDAARPKKGAQSLQGDSVAEWHEASGLQVVTTNLSPGYLRKNGVPYSEDAVLTEYYDRLSIFGEEWLVVTTVVEDPTYLLREFITSSQFKRLRDDSSWNPVPCEST